MNATRRGDGTLRASRGAGRSRAQVRHRGRTGLRRHQSPAEGAASFVMAGRTTVRALAEPEAPPQPAVRSAAHSTCKNCTPPGGQSLESSSVEWTRVAPGLRMAQDLRRRRSAGMAAPRDREAVTRLWGDETPRPPHSPPQIGARLRPVATAAQERRSSRAPGKPTAPGESASAESEAGPGRPSTWPPRSGAFRDWSPSRHPVWPLQGPVPSPADGAPHWSPSAPSANACEHNRRSSRTIPAG